MTAPRWPGLRLPVMVAPMFLVSGPDLVIAACRAGVIGSFPAPNCRSLEQLDNWMNRIAAEVGPTGVPWALNLVTHCTQTGVPPSSTTSWPWSRGIGPRS